jgi:hypothetical protein
MCLFYLLSYTVIPEGVLDSACSMRFGNFFLVALSQNFLPQTGKYLGGAKSRRYLRSQLHRREELCSLHLNSSSTTLMSVGSAFYTIVVFPRENLIMSFRRLASSSEVNQGFLATNPLLGTPSPGLLLLFNSYFSRPEDCREITCL